VAERAVPDVELVDATKRFGDVVAVDGVSLAIEPGSFFTFLGPSGCGKTTSLRLIAGFEQPDRGDVRIAGRPVVGVPPYRRPVNMVFQHYALFPHLDVFDNIAYGLRQRRPRPDRGEIARRVHEALELVRLPGFERRRVWELSGGQQQRVALARALVNRPTVLLLDEPLAALDRKLRAEMQVELQNLQREVGITFVLVTHDQEEALSMSDSICLMRSGRVVQLGSPRELYDEPASRYVADFVGRSNIFEGTVLELTVERATMRLADGTVVTARRPPRARPVRVGQTAVLVVRPELVQIRPEGPAAPTGATPRATGSVRNTIFLGEHTEYVVATETLGPVTALVPKHLEAADGGFSRGERVVVGWVEEAGLCLEAD
jgi:spermidine/putrescine transport system ATP-binding protein